MAVEERITQVLVEVDVESTSLLTRATQVYVEIDLLAEEAAERVWGPAANIM